MRETCGARVHIEIDHDRKTVEVSMRDPPMAISHALNEIFSYRPMQDLGTAHVLSFVSAKRNKHRIEMKWEIMQ